MTLETQYARRRTHRHIQGDQAGRFGEAMPISVLFYFWKGGKQESFPKGTDIDQPDV